LAEATRLRRAGSWVASIIGALTAGSHKLEGTLAFMFETRFPQKVSRFAAETPALQAD
jgi:homogentisate 1,2-dioxygenase